MDHSAKICGDVTATAGNGSSPISQCRGYGQDEPQPLPSASIILLRLFQMGKPWRERSRSSCILCCYVANHPVESLLASARQQRDQTGKRSLSRPVPIEAHGNQEEFQLGRSRGDHQSEGLLQGRSTADIFAPHLCPVHGGRAETGSECSLQLRSSL